MSKKGNNHFVNENFSSIPTGTDGQGFIKHMLNSPLFWSAIVLGLAIWGLNVL